MIIKVFMFLCISLSKRHATWRQLFAISVIFRVCSKQGRTNIRIPCTKFIRKFKLLKVCILIARKRTVLLGFTT